jgi:hypothetical protein
VEIAMSEQTKTRFAFDLDDLEKQLRQTAGSQPKVASSDPLADLARIVGQDDPFKSLFADRRGGAMPPPPVQVAPPGPRRIEPQLVDVPRPAKPAALADTEISEVHGPAAPLPAKDMLDEFDRLLRGELRGTAAPASEVSAMDAKPSLDDLSSGRDDFRDMLVRDEASADRDLLRARDLDALSSTIRAEENVPVDAGQPLPVADYPEPPAEQPADLRSLEPQQPRKGLVIAGMLLGVAALGVGAVVGLRGFSGPARTTGEVPVIKADAGPSKVAPQNPGGVEIPNQNKQIYERTPEPKPGEARVVTREEQPVDVQATARAAARVILPGPGAATAPAAVPVAVAPATQSAQAAPVSAPVVAAAPVVAPAASPASSAQPPAAALGEPRRVRTIAVRPDGTIAPANGAPPLAAAPAAASAATATPVRPAAPSVTASTPAPRPPAPRAAAEDAAAPRPAPPRTQVAAAPAAAPVAAPVAAPAPRATEAASAGGGFMVQLGAPGSEAEARSTFSSLQRRFSDQLASDSPVIRRADVGNGRTVYRLRVGPFSREDAAEKCQALQSAGGQCFIARN